MSSGTRTKQRSSARSNFGGGVITDACVEREVWECTVAQQSGLVIGHSITDLVINLRRRAFQGLEIVQVRHASGVLRPRQELLAGDDPN